MKFRKTLIIAAIVLLTTGVARAQDDVSNVEDPSEVLKIAALEALISAPPERALPLAVKVLEAENTTEVKERALFVLSQIDMPEAQARLLDIARSSDPELSVEAVRMIGIGGDPDALAGLADLYASDSEHMRGAVLEAYLIADDEEAVFVIAQNARTPEEFEEAVMMLGAMDAVDKLRALSETSGYTVELIEAMGIAGGSLTNETLLDIYRSAETADIREAVLHAMLISGYDEGVLQLYRESTDINEKRDLLQMLAIMDSDLMLEVLDEALEGGA